MLTKNIKIAGAVVGAIVAPTVAALLLTPKGAPGRSADAADLSNMPQRAKKKVSSERWRNAEEMWGLATRLGNAIGSPGLPGFMLAQAFGESRFKLDALNKSEGPGPNTARGIFQIRPSSGFKDTFFGNWKDIDPDLLYGLPLSVALDAWYIHRLKNWAPIKEIDWLAIRRGTAYPKNTKDFSETKQRSRETRGRFESALKSVGLPKSFMYEKVFPSGYTWPGVKQVMSIVGVDSSSWM